MPKPIYLDYNATTPHDPEVIAAMRPFFEEEFGNPSSSHSYGYKPKQAVTRALLPSKAVLKPFVGKAIISSPAKSNIRLF
jgi:cysteine sulfinate desulfinase/cysteine desulfurase-like protein